MHPPGSDLKLGAECDRFQSVIRHWGDQSPLSPKHGSPPCCRPASCEQDRNFVLDLFRRPALAWSGCRNGGWSMTRSALRTAFVVASLVALSVALAVACLALLLTPQAAMAQETRQEARQEARQERRQNSPGQFDFYVLSLSWSPS